MRLTEKQAKAVRHLVANPGASIDDLVAAAGASENPDNVRAFICRLIENGALRLDVTPEAMEALVNA
jgi:hypothetical protein